MLDKNSETHSDSHLNINTNFKYFAKFIIFWKKEVFLIWKTKVCIVTEHSLTSINI